MLLDYEVEFIGSLGLEVPYLIAQTYFLTGEFVSRRILNFRRTLLQKSYFADARMSRPSSHH